MNINVQLCPAPFLDYDIFQMSNIVSESADKRTHFQVAGVLFFSTVALPKHRSPHVNFPSQLASQRM